MFKLSYAVKGQVDGESFIAKFNKSGDAYRYLTTLKRNLGRVGCEVSGFIEKEIVEISNLVEV